MEAHKDLTTRFINPAQKYFREKCAFPIEKGRLKATALIIPDWTAEAPNELGETFAGIHHEYINNSPIPPNLSDHTSELISPLVQSYFFGEEAQFVTSRLSIRMVQCRTIKGTINDEVMGMGSK
jgi:hypothetical protein